MFCIGVGVSRETVTTELLLTNLKGILLLQRQCSHTVPGDRFPAEVWRCVGTIDKYLDW
jgi:hypothetical protein